ncbi:MAG: ArsA family ATPase [Micromonosporaceae bacterium]
MGHARLDLDAILGDPGIRIIVCCGAGGVGKTTTAAALALRAAERHGRRTVVLTIDPARRLAQSMGLTQLDNTPRPVPETKPDNGGELHAMMLDMKRTFDEVVLAHSTPQQAKEIFANPFYQAMSSTFAGTQEYMAMEKLSQLSAIDIADGGWDLIIVDTPPSRSALDFLDAPKRLAKFLDSRMLRILLAPARVGGLSMLKMLGSSLNIFGRAMHKILGGQLIGDLSTFVASLDSMFGGFADRAAHTYQVLQAKQTAFLVVATPEPDAVREAGYFAGRLSEEKMPLAGLVLNRVHGLAVPGLSAERAVAAAEALTGTEGRSAALTADVLLLHADLVRQVSRESRIADRFRRAHPTVPVTEIPAQPEDVHDLEGLRDIGTHLGTR